LRGWWNVTSMWSLNQIGGFVLPSLLPLFVLVAMLVHAAKSVFGKPPLETADRGS
jgi:hypothetical protein